MTLLLMTVYQLTQLVACSRLRQCRLMLLYCFVYDVGIDSNQCYRYYLSSFFRIVSFAVLKLSALVLMLPANILFLYGCDII